MLLVYGLIPRPARTLQAETKVIRANSIEGGMQEADKQQARARINFALKHPVYVRKTAKTVVWSAGFGLKNYEWQVGGPFLPSSASTVRHL